MGRGGKEGYIERPPTRTRKTIIRSMSREVRERVGRNKISVVELVRRVASSDKARMERETLTRVGGGDRKGVQKAERLEKELAKLRGGNVGPSLPMETNATNNEPTVLVATPSTHSHSTYPSS
eukprot:Gb_34612 [translate_table: standard]